MEGRRDSQSKLHNGEETPNLPEQVIFGEILPRLPVKSLLKFRCVAKSWCSLIGSKRFMKANLNYSIESSRFAHQWIFFDNVENEFKQCSLPSIFDADLGLHNKLDMVFHVGCCNPVGYFDGLVCILLNFKRFILWNPATKKLKNLPDFYDPIEVECGVIEKYGFGFDELEDDYKVFGIANRVDAIGAPLRCICMVYSLRTNSWKYIEERDVCIFEDGGMGVFVNGKLHWYIIEGYKCEIVSFDLNSYVYGAVEVPSNSKGVLISLGLVGGCLSAHFCHPNGDLDVWLMKEYGVKESWNKVVSVPPYEHPDFHKIPTPLAIAPNGEVLLTNYSTAMIYNPKCDVFRHPRITGLDYEFGMISSLGIYVESLASVDPDAQQEM